MVEHVIRLVKIFRGAGDKFRLNFDKYESVINTICGQVRLRIGALILDVLESGNCPEEIEIIRVNLGSALLIENPSNPYESV